MFNQQLGIYMMGGILSWLFIMQAVLVGALVPHAVLESAALGAAAEAHVRGLGIAVAAPRLPLRAPLHLRPGPEAPLRAYAAQRCNDAFLVR